MNDEVPPMPAAAKKPRGVRTDIALIDQTIAVYAGKRVAEALQEITSQMTVYHGVRLSQILEAVYSQGRKDGARDVFEHLENLKSVIPHRNPGHPKKPKR